MLKESSGDNSEALSETDSRTNEDLKHHRNGNDLGIVFSIQLAVARLRNDERSWKEEKQPIENNICCPT